MVKSVWSKHLQAFSSTLSSLQRTGSCHGICSVFGSHGTLWPSTISKILMVKNGPTKTERSSNILAIQLSLSPLLLYSGLISSSVRQEWTQYSNREWRIGSWTLVSASRLFWLLSFAILQVWTKVFVCILSKSTGGFQPCPSLCLSSVMMNAERPSFVAKGLKAGLQGRRTTKVKKKYDDERCNTTKHHQKHISLRESHQKSKHFLYII